MMIHCVVFLISQIVLGNECSSLTFEEFQYHDRSKATIVTDFWNGSLSGIVTHMKLTNPYVDFFGNHEGGKSKSRFLDYYASNDSCVLTAIKDNIIDREFLKRAHSVFPKRGFVVNIVIANTHRSFAPHNHPAVLLWLEMGRKSWIIRDPKTDFATRCDIHPGESFYLPDNWIHNIQNHGNTVAYQVLSF